MYQKPEERKENMSINGIIKITGIVDGLAHSGYWTEDGRELSYDELNNINIFYSELIIVYKNTGIDLSR